MAQITGSFNPVDSFQEVKTRVAETAKELLTLESQHRKILIRDVTFETGVSAIAFAQQRAVKEAGGTWSVKVIADAELQDSAGTTLHRGRAVIANLPMMTQRLTYIVGGREYQVHSQFRRMSGVYTRISDRGDIEGVAVNDRKGQLKMRFDPVTYQILIQPIRKSASTISLYDLLSAAGKTDEQIGAAWGKDLVKANKEAARTKGGSPRTQLQRDSAVISIAKKIVKEGTNITTAKDAAIFIFQQLADFTLDPRVTQDVLGRAHTSLTPDCLIDAGRELVRVSKGEAGESTYNNIGHKRLMSPGDLLRDYLLRNSYDIRQRLKNRMGPNSTRVDVLNNALARNITAFFKQGGETQLVTEADMTNPLATITGHQITTVLGMGGISMGPGMQLGSAAQPHASHIGFLDPVDTGEKAATGLILNMALGAGKQDDRLHTRVYDMQTGKFEIVDPLTMTQNVVAFPDDIEFVNGKPRPKRDKVRASVPRQGTREVPFSECRFVMVYAQAQFGLGTNMMPFLANNNGNRVMIGTKMARQAVSLVNREEPLVQVAKENAEGVTLENEVGRINCLPSPVDGSVVKITDDEIHIRGTDQKIVVIEKYNQFPTNDGKAMLHHEPLVAVGDSVKRGQLLVDSNYTRNGTLALGVNLRVGYLPMRGYNYEDGVVISRSASEKLTSEHLYTFERDSAVVLGTKLTPAVLDKLEDSSVVVDREMFRVFCARSARGYANFDLLDADGVIKEGAKVEEGMILIAACRRVDNDPTRANLMRTVRIKSSWRGAEESWDKEGPGVVTRVVKTGKAVRVYIQTHEPMKIGDKLTGRYGNKGIITKVLENHEMPYIGTDGDGNRIHLEVALHPAGMPGRTNIGQLMELGATKIAEKTGRTYVVRNFDNNSSDRMRELIGELKSHGLSDQEVAYDPKTNKPLGSIIAGKQYIYKLTHQVDKKMISRPGGVLPGQSGYKYDVNGQPTSGYPTGGQAMGALGIYALLGHNARAMLRDLQTHHSTYEVAERAGDYDSDDYWNALMQGLPLPPAKPTFTTRKFFSFIKAMGVDPVKNGDEYQLVPMTDADVARQCPHEVQKPNRMVRGKDGAIEQGGLFDFPEGDRDSLRWGHIKLRTRMVNPVFESAVGTLLGIPQRKVADVFAGKEQFAGGTGIADVVRALDKIDVQATLDATVRQLETARKDDRDLCYRRIKILKNLQGMGLTPAGAYTMKLMPVLPPRMRPIALSADVGAMGDINTVDINQLYKSVGIANDLLGEMPKESLPEDMADAAYKLYSKIRDAYVDGALDNKGAPMNSLLQSAVQPGDSAGGHAQGKEGFFQAKLIKRRSDLSGRSVITPEPELRLDQVGLPRKIAMNIYRPFVIRALRMQGYSTIAAAKLYQDDPSAPAVRTALQIAVSDRPLLMKRDPALHKHSILSFYPKIIEDKSIQIHPLVCGGFNADFDGDAMGVWVPSSDEAREDAKRMLPSKNLFGAKGFQIMNVPEWDAAYGIWQMTELARQTGRKYASPADAYLAHKTGDLDIGDVFEYRGKPTTVGRMMLFDALPVEYKGNDVGDAVLFGPELDKKRMVTVLTRVAKERPDLYPNMVDDWKDLGNKYAHEKAWSYGLDDFVAHSDIRDKHLKAADERLGALKAPTDADRVREYGVASSAIRKELSDRLAANPNRAWRMSKQSGALAGKYNQIEQMIVSPLQVMDADNKVVPNPVRKSYSEGLSVSDYWDSMPGVRSGVLARVKGTSEPGAKAKDLINLGISTVVSIDDCGTTRGVPINAADVDAEGRYLAQPIVCGDVTYKHNTLVDTAVLKQIRKYHTSLDVRSPITCRAQQGVCKRCAGLDENGSVFKIGDNAGVKSAQSLSEPLTQMAMRAFHTGGSAEGAGAALGGQFEQLERLITLPQVVKGAAVIATTKSSVVAINENTIAGGFDITLRDKDGETTVRAPAGRALIVKVGDALDAGDPLTDGPINPHELLDVAGIGAVRSYMLESLQRVYGEYGTRRRHTEMLLRNLTGVVEIVDDPMFEFLPGDNAMSSQIQRVNTARAAESQPPVKTRPKLVGINQAVRVATEGDFLAQMNYQHVRKSLIDGMTFGAKSNLHGPNPIPGIAIGAELGKTGPQGQY